MALNDAPGGEGEHRGGKGIVVEYRVRRDGCFFTCAYTRNQHLPWALDGGREGSPNVAEVIRADGSVEKYAVVTALWSNEGDVIRIHTATAAATAIPRTGRTSSSSTISATATSPKTSPAASTASTWKVRYECEHHVLDR